MSGRVEATVDELKAAAKNHRLKADVLHDGGTSKPCRSTVLLRFYGTEGGMKAKYLMRNRRRTTRDIPEGTFGPNGHDLDLGYIKALKVPAAVAGRPPTLRRRSNHDAIPMARAHEALRYGVELVRQDFDALDTWLVKLLNWLQEEGAA